MLTTLHERQLIFPNPEMEKAAEISLTKTAFKDILKRIRKESRLSSVYLNNENRRYAGEIAGFLRDETRSGRIEDSRYELLGQDIGFFIAHDNTLLITEGTNANDFNSDHKELVIFNILSPNIYNINGKITNDSVAYSIQDSIQFINKTKGWENLQLNLEKAADFLRHQNIKPEDFESYFK